MNIIGINIGTRNALFSVCVWIVTTGRLYAHYGLSGNFSITHLYSTSMRLQWDFNVTDKSIISGYDIFVRALRKGAGFHQYRIEDTLKGRTVNTVYDIASLQPGTEYEMLIYALSDGPGTRNDVIGASDRIVFRTLSTSEDPTFGRLVANPVELAIVISIVVAWAIAFGIFVHKWGTIRILQPRDYRWKHTPKNLETIKIVKRPTDSVIYRNYSQKLTTTMQERERKIERMSTMPNIKVDTDVKTFSVDRDERGVSALLSGLSLGGDRARFREAFLRASDSTTPLTPRDIYPSPNFGTFQTSIPEHEEKCPLITTKPEVKEQSPRESTRRNVFIDRRAKFRLDTTFLDEEEHMQMIPLINILDRASGTDKHVDSCDRMSDKSTETVDIGIYVSSTEDDS